MVAVLRARVVLSTASVRALHGSEEGLERCFTDAEMAQLFARADPVSSIAARLAAKVATAGMLKMRANRRADPCPDGGSVVEFRLPSRECAADLRRIEVLVSPAGAPRLVLDPTAHPSAGQGWVSLSHDAGLAAALVVLNC